MGEHRRVKAALIRIAVQETKPRKVAGRLLTEQTLTGNRIESHQDPALEQLVRWNRGASSLGLQLIEQSREPAQHLIHSRHASLKRMISRNVFSAHRTCRRSSPNGVASNLRPFSNLLEGGLVDAVGFVGFGSEDLEDAVHGDVIFEDPGGFGSLEAELVADLEAFVEHDGF